MEEYSTEQAKAYIGNCFIEQGDFAILPKDVFERMLTRVIELDAQYMKDSGVDDGGVYDDDDAYDFMFENLQKEFEDERMYCMRFVEDYMEYNEKYLDSIGAIDWE